jgi:outer membrane protein OmpA-like peptidoglycan-associated protein
MAQGASGEGFAYSMVDLMTSLVVIFILLLIVFLRQTSEQAEAEKQQAEAEKQQTEGAREQVMRRLREELGAIDAQIQVEIDKRDPLKLLVIVPEGLLGFEKNRAEIPPNGTKFLERFAPTLTGVLCAPDLKEKVDSLIIEGHADSSGTEKTNIPLSARRATEVMLFSRDLLLRTNAVDLEGCLLRLASASGRGPRDPIPDSRGLEDPVKSRRVEFKVRVRSIEQRKLQELQGQLHAERVATP